MRITKRQYQRAQRIVSQAKEQARLVKIWEDAMTKIGDQDVAYITVEPNGKIRAECIIDGSGRSEAPVDQ